MNITTISPVKERVSSIDLLRGIALAKDVYPEGSYSECFQLRMQEYFTFRNINLIYYLPKII